MRIKANALKYMFVVLSVWGFAFSASVATATPITFSFSGSDLVTSSTINGSLVFDDSLLVGSSPVLVRASGFDGFNFVTTAPLSATWALGEINPASLVWINTNVTPSQFVTGISFSATDSTTSSVLNFFGNTFTSTFNGSVTANYMGSWTTTGGSSGAPIPNPEPASLVLMGSGLIGLAFWRRKHPKV